MSRRVKLILVASLGINIVGLALFGVIDKSARISERVFDKFDVESPVLWEHKYGDLRYYPILSNTISVHGIAGFSKNQVRLDRLANFDFKFRPVLRKIGKHAAGVRLRFRTDSSQLHLPLSKLKPVGFSFPHLSEQGAAGVDLYIDNRYVHTVTSSTSVDVLQISESGQAKDLQLVELYLPSFSQIELHEIGIDPGSRLEQAPDFDLSIVFYGTSITQGASAPRPGATFPAIVARTLNVDFYNYGFAGNGRGDLKIAQVLTETNADIYVLKHSRQASGSGASLSDITDGLIKFCSVIKEKHPDAPIVIVTALYDVAESLGYEDLAMRRRAFDMGFKRLQKQYKNIHLVEGLSLLGPNDIEGLADGTHPNAMGMAQLAERLLPVFQPLLLQLTNIKRAE